MRILMIGLGILVAVVVIQVAHFAVVSAKSDAETNDGSYFSKSRDERRRFRARLRLHRRLLIPFFWLLGKTNSFRLQNATFHFQGIAGPKGSCSPESFQRGANYQPTAQDVFVVTQMKCGTTWMQNLVYELVTEGNEHLDGHALYAISPWLESCKTVAAEEGPMLGSRRPTRLIKTHFPVTLCPFDESAKYIYVVRHPISCFASCADFMASNLGPLTPPLNDIEQWYCSAEEMWWSPWPDHVAGWWQKSLENQNIFFIRFQDMKEDLASVARQVEEFLDIPPLSDAAFQSALEHCKFSWMSENFDLFEMQVPHLLQDASEFFKSGRVDRYRDATPDASSRIIKWCEDRLAQRGLSLGLWYPDPSVG